MINTWIGQLGHLAVIIAFVSAVVATLAYFLATNFHNKGKLEEAKSWQKFARINFMVQGLAVITIIASLFYIIYNHLYEYHYAWSHSSNQLPVYYMISCFWEGQEGSFLLWIFWHMVLGLILIYTNKSWENSVMTVFSAVQAFLLSMILGVVIFNLKIGSSPFLLLREVMPDIPIFQTNPDYRPTDGTGLNALLQNYWMVIHPPTLFLGFALTLVPFAYCVAGLWQKKYKDWIRPALAWSLLGACILGVGILMGAYWAYETLNFGGYWNWDPVENAVYIPWLVIVASIHTMIAFRKSSTALKASMILVISTFILILYSTFLTRSGILGNASVHSFTDLGLSGQLLLYLLFFTFLSVLILVLNWKHIPTTKKEISTYSREFWIFMGATVLCLSAFQVLVPTSYPVYNKIVESLGFVSNLAPPADQIAFYTPFQLWAGVFIAILSGTGQFFWWKKVDAKSLQNALLLPLIITLLVSALILVLAKVQRFDFIILMTTAIYSIVSNFSILLKLLKKKTYKLSGGSIAHIGIALMLLGILFSAGYSKTVSLNQTGLLLTKNQDAPKGFNEKNTLLWLNRPTPIGSYQVSYRGDYMEAKGYPGYISKSSLIPTSDPFKAVAIEDINYNTKPYFKKGDTLKIYPENTYYRVDYRQDNGKIFSLFPRAQINQDMGGLLASPDIHRQLTKDLYTHVSSVLDPSQPREWSETKEYKAKLKDTLYVNDYVAFFERVENLNPEELKNTEANIGIRAILRVFAERNTVYEIKPQYLIRDKMSLSPPEISRELGLKITLTQINPQTGEFTFAVNTTQKDYIIMKAMEKPMINLLWLGTFVLVLGFGVAIYRRYTEFVKMRDKGLE